MKASGPRIVIIGGGSVGWTPTIVRDMLLTPALANAQFVLLDLDQSAGEFMGSFCRKLAGELGVGASFTVTDQRSKALAGANYVLITIATGGLAAMKHDVAIPESFGIYHTVGDTSGPGGWARAIRNFDVFHSIATDINRYAPGAMVLNYSNPMTMLTDVLSRVCTGPVVGLCHALFENLELIQKRYGLASEADVSVDYAGINHFIWTTRATAGDVDVLADLRQRAVEQSLSEVFPIPHTDIMGFSSQREVATELLRLTGVLPYMGDRHICEFFNCYITDLKRMEKYKLCRTTMENREGLHAYYRQNVRKMLEGAIPDDFKKRSRETAADIISAHCTNRPFIDVGNVPNRGQIANLPRNLIVETPVRVDRHGFTPLAFGDLPAVVKGFIDPYAVSMPMIVDACFKKDRSLALQALRLDPVCAHLTGEQVLDLGNRLLGAHRQFITCFN